MRKSWYEFLGPQNIFNLQCVFQVLYGTETSIKVK